MGSSAIGPENLPRADFPATSTMCGAARKTRATTFPVVTNHSDGRGERHDPTCAADVSAKLVSCLADDLYRMRGRSDRRLQGKGQFQNDRGHSKGLHARALAPREGRR